MHEVLVLVEKRPECRVVAGQTRELARGDADDRDGVAVEPDGRADDGWVRSEMAAPKSMPEDDGRRRIRPLVADMEEPSVPGSGAELVEIVRGHEERGRCRLDAVHAQTRRRHREHGGERARVFAIERDRGIGHLRRGAIGSVPRESQEGLRIADGQWTQHDDVEGGERRDRGADADGQDENRGHRKSG